MLDNSLFYQGDKSYEIYSKFRGNDLKYYRFWLLKYGGLNLKKTAVKHLIVMAIQNMKVGEKVFEDYKLSCVISVHLLFYEEY